MKEYEYSMAHFPLPEQSINPPHMEADEYEREIRNDIRQDVIDALHLAVDRLDELDYDGNGRSTQKILNAIAVAVEAEIEE